VSGGTLRTTAAVRVCGSYTQAAGTALDVTLRAGHEPALTVERRVVLDRNSTLTLRLDDTRPPALGSTVPVIGTRSLRGQFGHVTVESDVYRAVPVYTAQGLAVRLLKR
jgi:hypothetical protein